MNETIMNKTVTMSRSVLMKLNSNVPKLKICIIMILLTSRIGKVSIRQKKLTYAYHYFILGKT